MKKTVKLLLVLAVALLSIPVNALAEAEKGFTNDDVLALTKMVWGEARGVSECEQRLVVWTVLQRLEHGAYGNSIAGIVRAPNQFIGYRPQNPVCPYIEKLVLEVLEKWVNGGEPLTLYPFAPSLPYLYFTGRNGHNWFREAWR